MSQSIKTAVLLAAGRGKRLRPHTDHIPKTLLPVNGRPTLDFVLASVARAGIELVCLVTHHLGEQIEQYVGDGSAWGLKIVTCRQPTLNGTANALKAAVTAHPALFLKQRPFLLSATDYIFPLNYISAFIAAHKRSNTDIMISLKNMPRVEIPARSTVQFNQNGQISRIIEKPSPGEITDLVSASLTFVMPEAILEYLPFIEASSRGEFEIQRVINQMIQDGYSAGGFVQDAPEEWQGSDTKM